MKYIFILLSFLFCGVACSQAPVKLRKLERCKDAGVYTENCWIKTNANGVAEYVSNAEASALLDGLNGIFSSANNGNTIPQVGYNIRFPQHLKFTAENSSFEGYSRFQLHNFNNFSNFIQFTSPSIGEAISDGMLVGIENGSSRGVISMGENWDLVFFTNNILRLRLQETGNLEVSESLRLFKDLLDKNNSAGSDRYVLTSNGSGTQWAARPKVYKATIIQTGTNAPTVTVLSNDFTGIAWNYTGVGSYTITNTANEFTSGKTLIYISPYNVSAIFGTTSSIWNSVSSIGVGSYSDVDQLTPANDVIGAGNANGMTFTIEVWP